jgi:hypothetical protein
VAFVTANEKAINLKTFQSQKLVAGRRKRNINRSGEKRAKE